MNIIDFETLAAQADTKSTYLSGILRPGREVLNIFPFNYDVVIGPLTDGSRGTTVCPIDTNSDFALFAMGGAVVNTATGGVNIVPNALMQITDNGTQKKFFDQPAQFMLVTGSNGLPFQLPQPRVIAADTRLGLVIDQLTQTGDTYNYTVCFMGQKIYYR